MIPTCSRRKHRGFRNEPHYNLSVTPTKLVTSMKGNATLMAAYIRGNVHVSLMSFIIMKSDFLFFLLKKPVVLDTMGIKVSFFLELRYNRLQ